MPSSFKLTIHLIEKHIAFNRSGILPYSIEANFKIAMEFPQWAPILRILA